jgi:putative endopeptidase
MSLIGLPRRIPFLPALALALFSTVPTRAADSAAGSGLSLEDLDESVAPGDDFFTYANGGWLKRTEIPPDRSSLGVFAMLADLTNRRTADLIRQTTGPAGSDAAKIADYYASYLDEAAIDARGLEPLQPALDRIAAIADRQALGHELGSELRADVDAINNTRLHTPNLLGLWVAQDLDDSTGYSPFLLQGGLEMPDRAYYVDASPRMAEIRTRYEVHIAAMLTLARVPDAEAKAKRILDLERRMAEVHWSRADSGQIKKADNHRSRKELAASAPGLDWSAYFDAAGLGSQQEFVVWQPSAVIGLSALVASQPLETWKDYLTFHAIEDAAPLLPKAFVDEHFAFHGTILEGTPQQRDRWKRAVDATNVALGDAVGRLYAEKYFPPSAKQRIETMVGNILSAFRDRIGRLDWMAPQTREKAKAKLAVLKVGVGYPDRWRDYSSLEVVRDDAFGNAKRVDAFRLRTSLSKLGQPVDRSEWVMTPQTVNAVNLPAMNALNFPAAILQPPFFDPARALPMDYGSIGAVIGHEISHSFDDQGAEFDSTGRLQNWWTDADRKHFEAAGERLVKQYDAYRPFPDLAVNGKQTLGENIADVAGLAAAYDAYRLSMGGKPAPLVAGLSGDRQFFLSFGQTWRSKFREPALRQRILGDGHSPGRYRAATVRNLDAWYAAFDVKPGQALYLAPTDRVRIW